MNLFNKVFEILKTDVVCYNDLINTTSWITIKADDLVICNNERTTKKDLQNYFMGINKQDIYLDFDLQEFINDGCITIKTIIITNSRMNDLTSLFNLIGDTRPDEVSVEDNDKIRIWFD